MIAHVGPISGISSYGGELVATAGYDNQVVLWDAHSGQAKARGFHDHLVNQCVFSPDGKFLATSSSDYSARIWSVPEMRLVAVLKDHSDDVEGLAFHPSLPLLATASRDHVIRLYDLGGLLIGELHGHKADVLSVAWDPEGRLISSSDDGTIAVWDAQKLEQIQSVDLGGVETDTIAISSNGVVLAGNDNGEIVISGIDGSRFVKGHCAGIKRLCLSIDNTMLVSLSYDRSAAFWSFDGREIVCTGRTKLPPIVWPRSCDFIEDNKVAFVTFGTTYAVYDLSTDTWDVSKIGDTNSINAIHLRHDGMFTVGDAGIVRGPGDTIVRLGSLCNFLVGFRDYVITGGQMGEILNAMTGEVYYQHHSPLNCGIVCQDKIVVGSYTGELIILAKNSESLKLERVHRIHDNAIKGLSSHGDTIFSVCATGAVGLTSLRDLETVDIIGTHDKIANGCAAFGDGRFCSVSRDLTLRIWHGRVAQICPTPHVNSIKCCAFNQRSGLVATADYTGNVGIYDITSEKYISFERYSASGISSIVTSLNGDGFVAASYDGQVHYILPPSASLL